MRKFVILFVILTFLFITNITFADDHIVLKTENADTVSKKKTRVQSMFSGLRQPDHSELYSLPRIAARFGIADWADIEIEYSYLYLNSRRYGDEYETGDLFIRAKAVPFKFKYCNLGIQIATKIPLGSNHEGLGTGEIDFFAKLLYTHNFGDLKAHVNLGVAFLEDPTKNHSQDDLFTYSVAVEYPIIEKFKLVGEIIGTAGSGHIDNYGRGVLYDDSLEARIGLEGDLFDGWKWGAGFAAGLNDDSPDWSLVLGISKILGKKGTGTSSDKKVPEKKKFKTEFEKKYLSKYHILETEEAYILPEGNFRQETRFCIKEQPDSSYLYSTPRVYLNYGIGKYLDFELEYEYLHLDDSDIYDSESGSGDVKAKIKITPFNLSFGTLGFQLITKMPNADEEKGLGTNETDFIGKILFSTEISSNLYLHTNIGFALQENINKRSSHNLYLIANIGAEYLLNDKFLLSSEITSSWGPEDADHIAEGLFGDRYAEIRFGLTMNITKDWQLGITASKGLTNDSPEWSFYIGVNKLW